MDKIEIQGLLHKIRSNCQYLTHIIHQSEVTSNTKYCRPTTLTVCPISCANIIIQLSYLLYVCSLLKIDVWISQHPIFLKASAILVFYISQEAQQCKEDICKLGKFFMSKAAKFNFSILPNIFSFIKIIKPLLSEKTSDKKQALDKINQFLVQVKKEVEPYLLNSSDLPIIKYLEKTKLFYKYSTLLKLHSISFFYQIKHNNQIIGRVRENKMKLQKYMIEVYESKDYQIVYKMLDTFIYQLVNEKIIYIQKTSSKDYINCNFYIVGMTSSFTQSEKQMLKYEAKFITSGDFLSQEKYGVVQKSFRNNRYILQYCMDSLSLKLKCITPIDPSSQQVDVICARCSDICFGTAKLSIEVHETHCMLSNKPHVKKNIAVKGCFQLQKSYEPFTLSLLLFDYVTICSHILMQTVTKLGNKDQSNIIQQYNLKLNHYIQMFVGKAQSFYKNI